MTSVSPGSDNGTPLIFRWQKALRRSRLHPTTLAVGYVMSTYANRDGTSVRPGVERVAAEMGVSEPTVKRALKALRAGDWLAKDKAPRYGVVHGSRATEYRLTIPANQPASDCGLVADHGITGDPMIERPSAGNPQSRADQEIIRGRSGDHWEQDQEITGDPLPVHDQSIETIAPPSVSPRLAPLAAHHGADVIDAEIVDEPDPWNQWDPGWTR